MDIYPLWWALSPGGQAWAENSTAIGAPANLIVIGITEREGINIRFVDFLTIGMVVLVVSVAIGLGILWVRFIW
ncbi:hypothetical protein [Methanofollis fontis]|uniref:hypothetical protein n=1 Tax=Methanofollis fontis TaxID=2052832 RepID=UPI001A91867F|nr:hypothetical protein [Methanofollis fontis]